MSNNIKFALVDDDKESIDLIAASLLEAFKMKGNTCTIYKYFNAQSFLSDLSTHPIDLLFCDIEMPNINGIELCKKIPVNKRPTIIFISNREDKVFEALELHPFGFIRKKNFLIDVNNIINNYLYTIMNKNSNSILVKSVEGNNISIDISNIMYIESDLKQQKIHLINNKEPIETVMTMTKLDENLSEYGFIRCHKSFIVNYKCIYSILTDTILLKNGEKVFVSKRKVKQIKDSYLALIEKDGAIVY